MKICNQVHQIKIDFNIAKDIKRYVYAYLITGILLLNRQRRVRF